MSSVGVVVDVQESERPKSGQILMKGKGSTPLNPSLAKRNITYDNKK